MFVKKRLVKTQLVTLELTQEEIDKIERLTGKVGDDSIESFVIAMAEEFVWPDERAVKDYLRRLK